MQWYEYGINVPYGNQNFDVHLGGAHDLDVATPLGTHITALLGGIITDISSPTWGKQICVKLDVPYRPNVDYMAYLHLGAVNTDLHVGMHIDAGEYLGLSGGAPYPTTVAGVPLFQNTAFMSSQPQTGVALMRGPIYGQGDGWDPISEDLDPTDIILAARAGKLKQGGNVPAEPLQPSQDEEALWYRATSPSSFAWWWGIPQSWLKLNRQGIYMGAPLGPEFQRDSYHSQYFSAGRADWSVKDGSVTWYTTSGKVAG